MIEYDYRYKHLQLIAGNCKIIIELSKDNMFKEINYSAKSNLLFLDNDETWGHAVGVGSSEEDALKMCYKELEQYLGLTFDKSITDNISILDIPKQITIENKTDIIILLVKTENNHQVILTNQGKIIIGQDVNIIDYLNKNIKLFINKGINNSSDEFLELNEFSPIFNRLSSKYTPNNSLTKDN